MFLLVCYTPLALWKGFAYKYDKNQGFGGSGEDGEGDFKSSLFSFLLISYFLCFELIYKGAGHFDPPPPPSRSRINGYEYGEKYKSNLSFGS